MPISGPQWPFFEPLFPGSTEHQFEVRSGQEMAFMRFIKIVRLPKYGLFGLEFKRSPKWAPMGAKKRVIRA